MTTVKSLVQDAIKVQEYPSETQEGFLRMIIERAVTLGHQQAIAAVQSTPDLPGLAAGPRRSFVAPNGPATPERNRRGFCG